MSVNALVNITFTFIAYSASLTCLHYIQPVLLVWSEFVKSAGYIFVCCGVQTAATSTDATSMWNAKKANAFNGVYIYYSKEVGVAFGFRLHIHMVED